MRLWSSATKKIQAAGALRWTYLPSCVRGKCMEMGLLPPLWCSVCAVAMLNCSADKGLQAIPIRGVSETHQAGAAYVTLASTVDWNTACRAGGGMPWLRRVRSPYRTRARRIRRLKEFDDMYRHWTDGRKW